GRSSTGTPRSAESRSASDVLRTVNSSVIRPADCGLSTRSREAATLNRLQHRGAAVVALHVVRRGHARDRGVGAAVRAAGQELEAAQAVDAAVAAGKVRAAQPRLVAGGTVGAKLEKWLFAQTGASATRRSRAMKKPSVPWTCGRSWRKRGIRGWRNSGSWAARSSASKSGWRARKLCTCSSFSLGEIVQVE